jgi:hypothetical protein
MEFLTLAVERGGIVFERRMRDAPVMLILYPSRHFRSASELIAAIELFLQPKSCPATTAFGHEAGQPDCHGL